MKRTSIFSFATLAILCGTLFIECTRNTTYRIDTYVYGYSDYQTLQLSQSTSIDGAGLTLIGVQMSDPTMVCSFNNNESLFKRYSAAHNDKCASYEVWVYGGEFVSGEHCFAIYDYTAVDVECDNDWDSDHLSGSSLNDIAHFVSLTPYPYILGQSIAKNPASTYFQSVFGRPYEATLTPVDKLVSELKTDELVLLGEGVIIRPFAYIVFEPRSEPYAGRECTLTVKFTTTTGIVKSGTITISGR